MKRKLVSFMAIGAIASLQMLALTSQSTAGNGACSEAATKVGGPGHDVLRGTNQRDVIKGRKGNDTIIGKRRGDVLCGGMGNDNLYGGRGADYLEGALGNDNLYGGRAFDSIDGSDGVDGNDWLNGQADEAECSLDMDDEEFNCLFGPER
jgi:Ca2+-binding RTX toxin-like protein